nr:MAG TPA: hypothetical protein [Caudoviricetes sp.]
MYRLTVNYGANRKVDQGWQRFPDNVDLVYEALSNPDLLDQIKGKNRPVVTVLVNIGNSEQAAELTFSLNSKSSKGVVNFVLKDSRTVDLVEGGGNFPVYRLTKSQYEDFKKYHYATFYFNRKKG